MEGRRHRAGAAAQRRAHGVSPSGRPAALPCPAVQSHAPAHPPQTAFGLTLKAAPPWMTDLIKIPKSVPVSRDLLPFKLTPRPAEPESFRGISKVSGSLASRERAQQSGSPFCWEMQIQRAEGRKHVSTDTLRRPNTDARGKTR